MNESREHEYVVITRGGARLVYFGPSASDVLGQAESHGHKVKAVKFVRRVIELEEEQNG